jgi:plastocyanin
MLRLICKFLIGCAAVSALIGGWLSGCSQRQSAATTTAPAPQVSAATQSTEQQVTIDNFAFSPQVLTVTPGTTVTWLNRDDVPHTATSSDSPAKFNSKAIDTDEKFSYVFTQPGTYPYFCAVHPKMTGKIVVK